MEISKFSEAHIKKVFGETVRSLRNQRKMSQEKLALDIKMDLTSVNEIERGHRSPKLVTVCKIAAALGVRPSQLLTDLS